MHDDTLAKNLKSLAHPRRVRIFRLLADNPAAGHGFQRLAQTLQLSESSLAHHLREMERCGVIRRHRTGANVAFVLTAGELKTALGFALRLGETARKVPRRAA